MTWRVAQSLQVLLAEVNASNPNRDKASDGSIGDAAHAARVSDHNPWYVLNGVGIVRARDFDKDGIDAQALFDLVLRLGKAKDPRVFPDGYAIYNRKVTNGDWSGVHDYTGPDPHTGHVHISVSTNPAGFDSTAAWGFHAGEPGPDPVVPPVSSGDQFGAYQHGMALGARLLELWCAGDDVREAQGILGCTADGYFGAVTDGKVRAFQQAHGLAVDGVIGPNTLRAMRTPKPSGVGFSGASMPAWPLPAGQYLGDIKGPAKEHGGDPRYDGPAIRAAIEAVQRLWIAAGLVPGVPASQWRTHGWADGKWDAKYSDPICKAWFAKYRPSQPIHNQVWADDYEFMRKQVF